MTTESRTSLTEVERLKLEMESLRGLLQRSIEERGRLERANRELTPVMHAQEISTLKKYLDESDTARAKIQKEHDELEQEMADLRAELAGVKARGVVIHKADGPWAKVEDPVPEQRRGFSFPAWGVFAGVLLLWVIVLIGIVWWLFFAKSQ